MAADGPQGRDERGCGGHDDGGSGYGCDVGPAENRCAGAARQRSPGLGQQRAGQGGEGLRDHVLGLGGITSSSDYRPQARIPAGRIELRELLLFLAHAS